MLEGLLLEVVCKEELKRTITHDFTYISVVLGFFWATLYVGESGQIGTVSRPQDKWEKP